MRCVGVKTQLFSQYKRYFGAMGKTLGPNVVAIPNGNIIESSEGECGLVWLGKRQVTSVLAFAWSELELIRIRIPVANFSFLNFKHISKPFFSLSLYCSDRPCCNCIRALVVSSFAVSTMTRHCSNLLKFKGKFYIVKS